MTHEETIESIQFGTKVIQQQTAYIAELKQKLADTKKALAIEQAVALELAEQSDWPYGQSRVDILRKQVVEKLELQ
ncbi:hypothetical protein UFOVP75_221 [uncultured Caudovirales phage]|uniref:Uncharacterized protein n=1 Tax=uncultured Caudovirales phage TaxID=2100421 RepID=A0A6J5L2M9_9CAUD|nr:hypothetical protein UFOVP75_221 [uncultured Caudovirales phage]